MLCMEQAGKNSFAVLVCLVCTAVQGTVTTTEQSFLPWDCLVCQATSGCRRDLGLRLNPTPILADGPRTCAWPRMAMTPRRVLLLLCNLEI